MFHDLCNPLTIKLMALDRPLHEAEEHSTSPPPGCLAYRRTEEPGSSLLPGRMTHQKAERLATVMVLWVVLLCAMMGYTISIAGVPEREPDNGSRSFSPPSHGTGRADTCGILPAGAGIQVGSTRSLLLKL